MKRQNRFKHYFQIGLLILATGSIYPLIFLRISFQTTILEIFGLTMQELSFLYMISGGMFLIGYIPSGWLADRLNCKFLVVFSLMTTGLIGLYYAQIPPKEHLKYIYLAWGFSTVFTYWGGLMKTIKLLSKPNEQAKVFGFLDGGRGIIEAVLATTVVSIFAYTLSASGSLKSSFSAVIYFYSVACLIIALLILIFLKLETVIVVSNKRNIVADIKMILVKKEVWLMSAIIFCGYTMYDIVHYLSGYLEINHQLTNIMAGSITTLMLWMRPIGGVVSGILGDKFGKTISYNIANITAILSMAILIFLPKGSAVLLFFITISIFGLSIYSVRGLFWSFLDDCKIPNEILGLAIGLISFLGYLPDYLLPKMSEYLYGYYSNDAYANEVYLCISTFIGSLGLIFTFYFSRQNLSRMDINAESFDSSYDQIVMQRV